jgi:NADPH-dependent curcumin reductase CurA
MAESKNHQWLLAQRPVGMIKESNFRWNETKVPPLSDGEVLLRNAAFSCVQHNVAGWRWTHISRRSRLGP